MSGEHKCIMEERIRSLENDRSETRVYVKEIRENLTEIKNELKSRPDRQPVESNIWQPIILELIKLAGLALMILGAIVGAAKILEK